MTNGERDRWAEERVSACVPVRVWTRVRFFVSRCVRVSAPHACVLVFLYARVCVRTSVCQRT